MPRSDIIKTIMLEMLLLYLLFYYGLTISLCYYTTFKYVFTAGQLRQIMHAAVAAESQNLTQYTADCPLLNLTAP
jgi:hypothetical protein